jgi:outer membrane protein OmpA-like peptidoglycan-associated protein
MISRTLRRIAVALMPVVCSIAGVAHAEPFLVSVEGEAAKAVTNPQRDLFGFGGGGALSLHYPITPAVLIGVRLQAGLLSNGDPPSDKGLRDPGAGTFEFAMLNLRLRPFGGSTGVRRAKGFFLDVGAGGGVTGSLARPAFSAGLGYGIPIDPIVLAPTVRYLQVFQPTTVLASDDARLVLLGIEITFGDALHEPTVAAKQAAKAPAPSDRDHDGIDDPHDKCPDEPEDHDGFQDDDGCPDPDNDGDGILDAKDKCPNQAEDRDEFEDEDGCPEPDNDHDGFADADDKCPNEPETMNGNQDFDGCPDEGLIVLENDRIVLEERVLFAFERARVMHEARPILRAIVKMKEQHPEWVSLRIEGHADARGDERYNQELSERRANHVMEELIKLGIPASQIHAVGFGASRLRDKRDDEDAHQRNRRVEFVVEAQRMTPAGATEGAATAKRDAAAEAAGTPVEGPDTDKPAEVAPAVKHRAHAKKQAPAAPAASPDAKPTEVPKP